MCPTATYIFAVLLRAGRLDPDVEPPDSAVLAAGEEGVGIPGHGQHLIHRPVVTFEGASGRLLLLDDVGEEHGAVAGAGNQFQVGRLGKELGRKNVGTVASADVVDLR